MLKVLELFAGIGACSKALERLGIEHEIVDAVEIDKYAIKSFNAIHGTNFETQDITEWDKDIECDLIMHGSPCQDFSLAGKQAGGDEGSGTRSSLMYETIRIVEKLKPKYVIWENVKNVLSQKHKHNFENYLTAMESFGYTNYYQVLNAKDYKVPQNRERIFVVSILNGGEFEFPPKQTLELRLKDILEDEVDEKYYLSEKMLNGFLKHNEKHNEKGTGFIWKPKTEDDIASCLRANGALCPTDNTVLRKYGIFDTEETKHQAGSVYDKNGLSPTLDTMQGGWRQPCVEVKNATKKGYQEAHEGDSVNLAYPDSTTRRGRVGSQVAQTLQCNDNMGVVTTLTSAMGGWRQPMIYDDRDKGFGVKITDICPTQRAMRSGIKCIYPDLRIRKLTPKECWRLMGFDDEDFDKAEKVNSNTQLYKQAGNSIVVNVLQAILNNLIKE